MYTQTVSVAPMLAYTNRHARYLYRLLSRHTQVYTEMIHAQVALSKKSHRYLAFSEQEHPVVVQLAGNDPQQMAKAAKVCRDYGYDAININIGCPSNKVRMGEFGACLMEKPHLVARVVDAMTHAVDIPVTIKCRLGIDAQDYRVQLPKFINITTNAGCQHYIIHARMAWLKGISPKKNRELPPLDYDMVYQLKKNNPKLHITINGGINSLEAISEHLQHVDGVMIGRIVNKRPAILQEVEHSIFGGSSIAVRELVHRHYSQYAQQQLAQNANVATLIRPLFALFAGKPAGGIFRRRLAQRTDLWKNMPALLEHALEPMAQAAVSDKTHNTLPALYTIS